eukprot:Tbor_TRINITY_DN5487_c8_g11::TRINITY_DN5487_c8_g11_i1::g.24192::m.24192/K08516/YKT6; synaptobrevin homolog YKT6
MKLFAIFIMNNRVKEVEPLIITSARDLSTFSYFQRHSANELLVFLARTVAKRVGPGRSQIKQDAHVVYSYTSSEGYSVIAVCDEHYNSRVAFSMIQGVNDDFCIAYRGKWEDAKKDECIRWVELEGILAKYQKPEEADKLLKLKKDIDDTKVIMYQAIDELLARGEKIDDLVVKSEDLGVASKSFYSTAKKANSSCCVIS